MAEQKVTREAFIQHIEKLIRNDTNIPCTMVLPGETKSAAGWSYGQPTISFWRGNNGVPQYNSSVHGQRGGFFKLSDIIGPLDEEEQLAQAKGYEIEYIIGRKVDKVAMEKRLGGPNDGM